jgi:hypothetical protein
VPAAAHAALGATRSTFEVTSTLPVAAFLCTVSSSLYVACESVCV